MCFGTPTHPLAGGPDRSYNQFYAAIKSSGRYELVGSPAEADLIFEIEFRMPTAEPHAEADRRETLVPVAFDPQVRLAIRDPKTNVVLWESPNMFNGRS